MEIGTTIYYYHKKIFRYPICRMPTCLWFSLHCNNTLRHNIYETKSPTASVSLFLSFVICNHATYFNAVFTFIQLIYHRRFTHIQKIKLSVYYISKHPRSRGGSPSYLFIQISINVYLHLSLRLKNCWADQNHFIFYVSHSTGMVYIPLSVGSPTRVKPRSIVSYKTIELWATLRYNATRLCHEYPDTAMPFQLPYANSSHTSTALHNSESYINIVCLPAAFKRRVNYKQTAARNYQSPLNTTYYLISRKDK